MTRFNLSQLIQFLINENQKGAATYFAGFQDGESDQVVDGKISADLVRWYCNDLDESGKLLRKIQANVISYIRLPLTDASMGKSI